MSETTEIMNIETTDAAIYTPSAHSTLSITDSATKKLVVNAMNSAESLAEWEAANPGGTLNVIGLFMKPGIRRSRDKNIPDAPCTNTTLVCEDGSAYFSQSEGIRNSADNFVAAGLFDDGEVIQMRVKTTTLRNGNTVKSLVIV